MYSLRLLHPESPPLLPLRHYYPPSLSAAAAAASLSPAKLSPACSHRCIYTRIPGALSEPSHSSNSDRVAMYYATMFCRRRMYSSIVKNPASSLAVSVEVCVHFLSSVLCWDPSCQQSLHLGLKPSPGPLPYRG